jgi:hypothetical protein
MKQKIALFIGNTLAIIMLVMFVAVLFLVALKIGTFIVP